MRDRMKRKIVVEIDNLTEAQEIALHDLFATWQQLGSWGSSRDTTFFADGDGDFRPKITVNGEKPKFTDLLPRDQFWKTGHGGDYRIDFDWIGWKLAEKEEAENPTPTYVPQPVDWNKPHHFMAPEGWDSNLCPDCDRDYNDPVHIGEPPETAESAGQLGPWVKRKSSESEAENGS